MNSLKKKLPMTNIGITTIITVFIVVCLVTFAALSFVNARNDKRLSEQVATHNDEYYEASNQANQQIAELAQSLSKLYEQNSTAHLSQIPESYSYEYQVGSSHSLYVTIVPSVTTNTGLDGLTPIQYIEKNQLPLYKITRFEVVTTTSWDGDSNPLPLQTFGQ